ncbi:MAG: ATP-binding protein, partial [Anaerolineae bacterium]|nr:ATP-binding protein [Anaerolineae bacterium]
LSLLMDGVFKASERKMAEEALRQSEERYKTIINNLPNGLILIFDPDFCYIFGSGEGMQKAGISGGLLQGKPVGDIFGTETGEKMAHHFRSVLAGESVRFEMTYAGQEFMVHAAPLCNEQDEITQILALLFIITERKLAEQRLRISQIELQDLLRSSDLSRRALLSLVEDQKQAEENLQQLNLELESRVRDRTVQLEAAIKELEAFSYSVSHDLRAPLRTMDGFSNILISDYREQLDEQGRFLLTRIQDASQRMGCLIEDLLNLSRVTRQELTCQQVNLSLIVLRIAAELNEQNPSRHVKFEIEPDLFVSADPSLIKIAMENLINNAFKFTSQREDALIKMGTIYQNDETVYFVQDNGAGFDMAYAGKLFAPFQRLHSVKEFPGTGIGLVIVQRIIMRHGGRIWPQAEPEKGATFFFTFGA